MTIQDLVNLNNVLSSILKYCPIYNETYSKDFKIDAGLKYGFIDDVGTDFEGYVYEYLTNEVGEEGGVTWKFVSLNNKKNTVSRTIAIKDSDVAKLCHAFKLSSLITNIDNYGIDIVKITAMADHINRFPEEYKTLKNFVCNRTLIDKMIDKPNFKLENHLDLLDFVGE